MGANAVTVPQLQITGVTFQIVPNSLKTVRGRGSYKVKFESSGGGSGQAVYERDMSEAVSKLDFKMFPTEVNIAAIQTIQDNGSNNTALVTNPDGNFTEVFPSLAMTNDPMRELGADGTIEVNMSGDPAQ